MAQHAKLSASSSDRWLTCPASIKACEGYKNTTNSASEYGTAAHALSEMYLLGAITTIESMLGKDVEGVTVDREMIKGVEEYCDYFNSYASGAQFVGIEERMSFNHLVPEGFGTADGVIIKDNVLHIIDLKFGHNIVNAGNNSQLSLYALGAILEHGVIHDIEEVHLHIVQPRANHFDVWETTPLELEEWGEWVKGRAELALSNDAPFNPTAKACKYCQHQHNCVALSEHVNSVVLGDFDNLEDLDGQADKIDTKHIKNILDNMDLITGFLKAVEQVAHERLLNGEKIDGYKLVQGRKNKTWTNEKKAIELLKSKFDDYEIFNMKLITPTQALKLVGKKGEELLDNCWSTPEGAPTLVTSGDTRPAIGSVVDEFDSLS